MPKVNRLGLHSIYMLCILCIRCIAFCICLKARKIDGVWTLNSPIFFIAWTQSARVLCKAVTLLRALSSWPPKSLLQWPACLDKSLVRKNRWFYIVNASKCIYIFSKKLHLRINYTVNVECDYPLIWKSHKHLAACVVPMGRPRGYHDS